MEGRWLGLGRKGAVQEVEKGKQREARGPEAEEEKDENKVSAPLPSLSRLAEHRVSPSLGRREGRRRWRKEVFSYWGPEAGGERRRPLVNGRKTDNLPREKVRKKSFVVYCVVADRANAPFTIMTLLFSINPPFILALFFGKRQKIVSSRLLSICATERKKLWKEAISCTNPLQPFL